ncbi:uncharacterized protein [Amphiura filiformis]|uniref:uncharacterized protein n=1 Tax=Amphiura filiformis TaxID=82378 RepID=UPI003B22795F
MSLPLFFQRISRKFTNVTQIMARNPETTIVCLALLFQLLMTRLSVTWSGAASDDTPTPQPNRIFPTDSFVYDYPDGNLNLAQQRIQEMDADVSLAMYYAHWDSTSLLLAHDLDDMAKGLVGKVTFVAVNCWWPYGACRQKIQAPFYPVLIAHHGQQEGLQYKGILTAPEIHRFLHKVTAPFLYVTDKDMLDRLQAQEDTLVIAHFNFTNYQEEEPPGFDSFHRAALLALEKDPIQHVQFGIITNPTLAESINLDKPRIIVLLRTLKEPLYYPAKRKFKAKFIMHWVFDNREQLVQWIVPVGVKSLIMSKQLQTKPAVILFTPHMHSNSFLNDIHLLRILAMDYYNCNSSTNIYHKIRRIELERQQIADDISRTENGEQCCQTVALTTKVPHIADMPVGRQNVCEVCEQFTQAPRAPFDACSLNSQNCHSTMLNTVVHNLATSPDSCLYVDNYYSPYSHFELCCKSRHLYNTHKYPCNTENLLHQKQLQNSDDSLIMGSSNICKHCYNEPKSSSNQQCKHFGEEILHKYKNCTEDETFSGLGCRTNKSVNFFAIRMDLYEDFAERLGLRSPVMDSELKSALALIDIKNEIQHMLPIADGLITAHLQELLVNFTRANLSRHLRSAETTKLSTSLEENDVTENNDTGLTVQEVVSATFEAVVLHSKQVSLYNGGREFDNYNGTGLTVQEVVSATFEAVVLHSKQVSLYNGGREFDNYNGTGLTVQEVVSATFEAVVLHSKQVSLYNGGSEFDNYNGTGLTVQEVVSATFEAVVLHSKQVSLYNGGREFDNYNGTGLTVQEVVSATFEAVVLHSKQVSLYNGGSEFDNYNGTGLTVQEVVSATFEAVVLHSKQVSLYNGGSEFDNYNGTGLTVQEVVSATFEAVVLHSKQVSLYNGGREFDNYNGTGLTVQEVVSATFEAVVLHSKQVSLYNGGREFDNYNGTGLTVQEVVSATFEAVVLHSKQVSLYNGGSEFDNYNGTGLTVQEVVSATFEAVVLHSKQVSLYNGGSEFDNYNGTGLTVQEVVSATFEAVVLHSKQVSLYNGGSEFDNYNDTGFTVQEVVSATFEAVVLHSKQVSLYNGGSEFDNYNGTGLTVQEVVSATFEAVVLHSKQVSLYNGGSEFDNYNGTGLTVQEVVSATFEAVVLHSKQVSLYNGGSEFDNYNGTGLTVQEVVSATFEAVVLHSKQVSLYNGGSEFDNYNGTGLTVQEVVSATFEAVVLHSKQGGRELDNYNGTGLTVQEVVSATFEAVVLHSKQNVLLFYYAPWCGFCAQLHHIYHLLGRLLKDTPNLYIARINGDLNDLPWEFSVPEYPTLLLFPARRKDNSIRYPEDWPFSLPYLLRFVLENMQ